VTRDTVAPGPGRRPRLAARATCLLLLLIGCSVPRPAAMKDGSPRFADRSDGTVRDNETGLVWARDANVSEIRDPWDGLTWDEANALVAEMNVGKRPNMGCIAWRLPDAPELQKLVAAFFRPRWVYAAQAASIDANQIAEIRTLTEPFQNFTETAYWSASQAARVPSPGNDGTASESADGASALYALAVDTSGTIFPLAKTEKKRVWPVCGATAAPERSCSSLLPECPPRRRS